MQSWLNKTPKNSPPPVGSITRFPIYGSLSIGDLGDVNISATAGINVNASLGLKASSTDTDGKIRLSDLTNNLSSIVTGGLMSASSVQAVASCDADVDGLPDIPFTITFPASISTTGGSWQFSAPTYTVVPSPTWILNQLGGAVFSTGDQIPVLGPLANTLNSPLPLINESIAQLTGLDKYLPTLPSLPISLSNLDQSYSLAGGTLTLDITQSSIEQFVQGKDVDLISWQTSGDIPLLDYDLTIPIYSLGVPGIASLEIDATFGIHADLEYNFGFGLDGNGIWLSAGNSTDPNLGLTFGFTAGLQGQVEIFGLPLVKAGGDIGFEVTPYVTLTPAPSYVDPNTDPNKVYLKDLAVFGPDPISDIADDLSLGIEGAFTGDLYASLDLFFFSINWNWGITIPVFNFERSPTWPHPAGSGPGETPWANVSDNGSVLTFDGTSVPDDLTVTQGAESNGSYPITIDWPDADEVNSNYATSETFDVTNLNPKFVFSGGSGDDALTTPSGSGLSIPVEATGGSGSNDFDLPSDTGNDTLIAGTGSNTLIGGSGNDELIGGPGTDSIVAGTGNDTIYGGGGGDGVDSILLGSGKDTFDGGSADYLIQGSSGTYDIDGGSASDTISAGSGANDTIYGGSGGKNSIIGSSGGDDLIFGGGPGDTIVGGSGGNDTIHASAGSFAGESTNNVVYGGTGGNNLIFGGGSGDVLFGMSGNNTIYGGAGNETIYGGDGSEGPDGNALELNPLDDQLYAPAGDGDSDGANLLIAGSGNDVIFGDSTGNNTLQAGPGNDTLFAGTGADFLAAGSGTDAMFGGGGGVTFQMPFTPIVTPVEPTATATQYSNTLTGVSNLADIVAGETVTGPDIPSGTIVTGISTSADSITLSNVASNTVTGTYSFEEVQPQDTIVGGAGTNTLLIRPSNSATPADPVQSTQLTAAITDDTSQTDTITVTSAAGIAVNTVIQIDSEEMQVTNVNGNTLTVSRGFNGTTEATHVNNATVVILPTQLVDAITDTNPTDQITVASAAGISVGSIIEIDSEDMEVTGISAPSGSGTTLTVTRGVNGTAIATHLAGAQLLVLPATSPAPTNDYQIEFTAVPGTTQEYQATLSNLDTGAALGTLSINLPASIANVDIDGGPGNNFIQVDPSVTRNMYLYGGPGHNTLMGGSGDDTLVAGPGTSVLYGGSGNDVLYAGDDPALENPPQLIDGTATSIQNPTDGDDTLIAGSGDDELYAGTGNDVLMGGSVARTIGANGSPGLASLQNGQYQLIDGAGRDVLYGGSGDDLLIAGPGSPGAYLEAGTGNTTLVAENFGADILKGGAGDDLLLGGNLSNVLIGGSVSGTDETLVGGLGVNTLLAGNGNDVLYATYNAAAWSQAEASAAGVGVHLVPPQDIFLGDTLGSSIQDLLVQLQEPGLTASQYADIQSQLQPLMLEESSNLQNQEENLYNEFYQLESQQTLTPTQQQDLTSIINNLQAVLKELSDVLAYFGGTTFVDSLYGGSGNDLFYGNLFEPTYMGGGTGNSTFYNFNGFDTIEGSAGDKTTSTVMFQGDGDFDLQPFSVNGNDGVFVQTASQTASISANTDILTVSSLTGLQVGQSVFDSSDPGLFPAGTFIYSLNSGGTITLSNNASGTVSGATLQFGWVVGNIPNITTDDNLGVGQIGNINGVGVTLLSGTDSVTAGNFQDTGLQLYVQCGSGSDTVNAGLSQSQETLLGGSGSDVIQIGAQIATGSIIQAGTGDDELEVQAPNGANVSVSGGTLRIGSYTLPSYQGFQKLVVQGGAGSDNFSSDGSIPNVEFIGGSGVNTLSVSGGMDTLIGGSGTNTFNVTGGTDTVIGGNGAVNNFNITGQGDYTVIGGTPIGGGPIVSAQPAGPGVNAPAPSGTTQSAAAYSSYENWDANSIVATVGENALFTVNDDDDDEDEYPSIVYIYNAATGQWSSKQLSETRGGMAVATVGAEAMFAGGVYIYGDFPGDDDYYPTVDIYNSTTGDWSTANLSQGREDITTARVGNEAVFAGGTYKSGGEDDVFSNAVDIYDSSTGQWFAASLSQARDSMAVTTVGTLAIFAGGNYDTETEDVASNVVDIYDSSTGQWSTATPSQPRSGIAATTVGDKAIFAGGSYNNVASSVVDIYNASTGQWSTASISQARFDIFSATVGTKAIFAGGLTTSVAASNAVDIYDASTGSWSTTAIPGSVFGFSSMTTVGENVVITVTNNGEDGGGAFEAVDIYNVNTGQWSTTSLVAENVGDAATSIGTQALLSAFYASRGAVDIVSFPPVVTAIAPSSSSHGTAAINYTLAGVPSTTDSVQVQYSVDGGPWQNADGSGANNLTASPGGTQNTFVWNTQQDLGNTDDPSVQVRITPSDAIGTGDTATSSSFAVDNAGVVNALNIGFTDSNNDTITLAQNGSTMSFGGSLTATATNMTSISVFGGSGTNKLDASKTIMPVTLYGGNGAGQDTLIGGLGSDTFMYSGQGILGSAYVGGGGADNELVYPTIAGDSVAFLCFSGNNLIDDGQLLNLGDMYNIESLFVSGSPASVNNSPQTFWPIEDEPLTNATISSVTTTANSPFVKLSASYTDPNPNTVLVDQSASINWGNGSVTWATVTSNGNGNYTVSGSHIYGTDATYTITVTMIESMGSAVSVGTTFTGGLAVSGGSLENYAGSTPAVVDSGDSGVASYAVRSADSTLFSLHTNGDLFAFTASTSKQIDSAVQSIAIGPDGNLYDLHTNGSLYTASPGSITPAFYSGNVQSLLQDTSGNLYDLTGSSLYVIQAGSSWILVDSDVASIALATGGAAVDVVLTDGNSWQFTGATGTFMGGPQLVLTLPATTTAGQSISVTLTATDAWGNPIPGYNGTVTFVSSDSAAVAANGPLPADVTLTDGTYTFTTTFLTSGTQAISVSDNFGNMGSASTTVDPSSLATFGVVDYLPIPTESQTAAAVTAGTQTTVTVTPYDAFGNVVTNFSGTVALTSPNGNLSVQHESNSNGIMTYTVTLGATGGDKITATSGSGSSEASGAGAVLVTAAPLSLSTSSVSAPTSTGIGVPIVITITTRDAEENQEPNGGLSVGIDLGPGSAGGTIGLTQDNSNGTYSIEFTPTALGNDSLIGVITQSGNPETLTSSPANMVVTAGAPDPATTTITTTTQNLTAGTSTVVTLTAVDADGDAEPGGLPIHFSLGNGAGSGTFGAVAYDGGGIYSALFTATTAGSNTIIATLNGQTITATPAPIDISADSLSLSATTVTVSPTTVTAGGAATITVTALDADGNPETGALDFVFSWESGSAGGAFGPLVSLGNGVYTETFTPTFSGTDTIVASTSSGQQITSATPVVTAPTGPTGTITTDQPAFIWPAASGASTYTLTITDETTKKVALSLKNLTAGDVALTSAEALTPGHAYKWSAQDVAANGKNIGTAGTGTFTEAPLAAPALTAPSGPIATDMPTFTWTDAAGTNSPTAHFVLNITDTTTKKALPAITLSGTTFTYTLSSSQALTPGQSYTWSITAESSNSQSTVKSTTTGAFSIEPLAAPTPDSPTGSISTSQPTFTWTPLINANYTAPASYTLTITDVTTGKALPAISKLTGTSYTLTLAQALTPGNTYTWSVAAISTNGLAKAGKYSARFAVASLTAPVLVSASGGTFTWQQVTDAASYILEIKTSAGTVLFKQPAITGESYTLSTKQAAELVPGEKYTWMVAAVSTNGLAEVWSKAETFTDS